MYKNIFRAQVTDKEDQVARMDNVFCSGNIFYVGIEA